MIDLSEIGGLPIKFDESRVKMYCNDGVECETEFFVPLSHLSPILLNKYLRYPETVYKHHKNIGSKDTKNKNFNYDLIFLPYGLLGIEYVKTHIYYSKHKEGKYDCIVEVMYGELTVLMQKNQEEVDEYSTVTPVEEIVIVSLKKGQRLAIPTGVFYTFANTGMTSALFSKLSSKQHKEIDYEILRKEKGLAFYLISKNAKIEVVANPKYKTSSRLRILNIDKLRKLNLTKYLYEPLYQNTDPVYKLFINNLFNDSLNIV
jgi:oxalate decarboxylase/phosphoglucose isomerase-like protein (cupin superfamily)